MRVLVLTFVSAIEPASGVVNTHSPYRNESAG